MWARTNDGVGRRLGVKTKHAGVPHGTETHIYIHVHTHTVQHKDQHRSQRRAGEERQSSSCLAKPQSTYGAGVLFYTLPCALLAVCIFIILYCA